MKGESFYDQIDRENLPRHVAVIMDGNGRWAKKHGKPRVFGHKNGVQSVREITETAAELGIKFLTLYAFSTENWSRPPREVSALMGLLVETIHKEMETLNKKQYPAESHRRTGSAAGKNGECTERRHGEDPEQRSYGSHPGTELQQPLGTHRDDAADQRRSTGRKDKTKRNHRIHDFSISCDPVYARPRIIDPDQRRDAAEQLSVVAECLYGVLFFGQDVAGV